MLIRVMLGLATACAAAVQPDSGVKHFQLSVPAAVEASQMHLLLRDVVVARNAPIVLRAYAVGAEEAVHVGLLPEAARIARIARVECPHRLVRRLELRHLGGGESISDLPGADGAAIPAKRCRRAMRRGSAGVRGLGASVERLWHTAEQPTAPHSREPESNGLQKLPTRCFVLISKHGRLARAGGCSDAKETGTWRFPSRHARNGRKAKLRLLS